MLIWGIVRPIYPKTKVASRSAVIATDTTKVAAAGATMDADTSLAGNG
jgi:hypothetical protein